MSDIREEWFKLVLNELRKNNDKVDKIKDNVNDKIDTLEDDLRDKLAESSRQHLELFETQGGMIREHARMNDLLEEHMRRTTAAESRIEMIQTQIDPVVKAYHSKIAVDENNTKNWKRAAMYLGVIATALSIISAILKYYKMF